MQRACGSTVFLILHHTLHLFAVLAHEHLPGDGFFDLDLVFEPSARLLRSLVLSH